MGRLESDSDRLDDSRQGKMPTSEHVLLLLTILLNKVHETGTLITRHSEIINQLKKERNDNQTKAEIASELRVK